MDPLHRLLFPASTYMIDDGTAEDAVGLTLGGDVICLNEFAVLPGSETIASISIAWGTPAFPDPSLNGLSYTAVLWSDPNGDGNPTDAVVLATAPGVVANQGTDTFLVSNLTPTTVTTANFFVGFIVQDTFGGQFPCAFDETNPTFSNRSYIAGGATGDINNLNNNDLPVAPIESFGLIGNWLIRADAGGGGGGDLTLDSAASVKGKFSIDLPLTGTSGVEDRTGGKNDQYTIEMTFNNVISSVGGGTTSCGTVQNVTINPTDAHKVRVNLKDVTRACNAEDITVAATGVTDDQGNNLASASVVMGLLIGDVNGDRTVSSMDSAVAQNNKGQKTDSTNFRSDVNASGHIDNSDVQLIRSQSGRSLP